MTTEALSLAAEAVSKARAAYRDAEDRRSDALDAAKRAVYEQFRAEIEAAREAVAAAERAYDDAKLAAPAHPWLGQRVTRKAQVRSGYKWVEVDQQGVVEVRTRETKFPANESNWRTPDIGVTFVRLLKADGTPGLRYERLTRSWTLVSEA